MEKRGLLHKVRKNWVAYLLLGPSLFSFGFWSVRCLYMGFKLSFLKASLTSGKWVGLGNFIKLSRDPLFWISLKNTIMFTIVLVLLGVGIAFFVSLVIFKFGNKVRSLYRAAFYLPVVSAGVVMTMVWLWIFDPAFGLLNYLLSLIGIKPIFWLAQANTGFLAVVIVVLTWTIGVKMILYLSALAAVPESIYEAARIDGANSWQMLWHITLPLVAPTTAFLMVTSTIGYSQLWQSIMLLTSGGPAYGTNTLVFRIYQTGFQEFDFGIGASYAVVLFLFLFPVAFYQFRYLNKKLEF